MDTEEFLSLRTYAFHATPKCNLDGIRTARRLVCAARRAASGQLPRGRRKEAHDVRVNGGILRIPDQIPLIAARVDLAPGWTIDDLAAHLDRHVFFWPGDDEGPIRSGRGHAKCYAKQPYAFLRVPMADLLAANAGRVLFCAYNSGAPGARHGSRSPRGPGAFVDAATFDRAPSGVIEVVFPDHAVLPPTTECSGSYDGPWTPMWPAVRAAQIDAA